MNSEAVVLPSNGLQLLPSKFLRTGHHDLCRHRIYLFIYDLFDNVSVVKAIWHLTMVLLVNKKSNSMWSKRVLV